MSPAPLRSSRADRTSGQVVANAGTRDPHLRPGHPAAGGSS